MLHLSGSFLELSGLAMLVVAARYARAATALPTAYAVLSEQRSNVAAARLLDHGHQPPLNFVRLGSGVVS